MIDRRHFIGSAAGAFILAIGSKSAAALGITIAELVLQRVDVVIG